MGQPWSRSTDDFTLAEVGFSAAPGGLLVVAVDAVAPGAGKSSIAGVLAEELAHRHTVVLFEEAEILTEACFAEVANEFRTVGRVVSETLLRCTRRYLAGLEGVDIVVLDALLPFIGSLMGWGADLRRVSKFVDSLAETLESLGCVTVFVYLDGEPSAALDRAIAREADPRWLDWLIATLRDADGPPVLDRPSLERFLERRRESATRLLSKPGRPWTLRVIHDAVERSPEDVLTAVRGALPEGSR